MLQSITVVVSVAGSKFTWYCKITQHVTTIPSSISSVVTQDSVLKDDVSHAMQYVCCMHCSLNAVCVLHVHMTT